MQSLPPPPQSAVTPPWQAQTLSKGAKFSLLTVCALLLIVLLVSLFIAVMAIITLTSATAAAENTRSNLIALGVAALVTLGSLAGLIVLGPKTRATTDFTPSYGAIPSAAIGQPFDVRFNRYLWHRSMRGNGTVRFDADGLTYAGHLEPSGLFQLGIVLLVTFVPLILFRVGLGIISALIIAYYVGRKNVTQSVLYNDVSDLHVEGSRVTFRRAGVPKQISLAVAQVDGERLYRELLSWFPAALGGWVS